MQNRFFITTIFLAGILFSVNVFGFGVPLPRIAPKSASPAAYFVNTKTGEKFTPLGTNYVRLDWIGPIAYHTTFNSAFYDARAAEKALAEMSKDGYNIVRVFLDQGESVHQAQGQFGMNGPFETKIPRLYPPTVNNFIDFLSRARNHGIYVIPVCEFWPYNKFYDTLAKNNPPADIEHINGAYLSRGCIEAKKTYLAELVESVIKAEPKGTLLSTVFSWELTNEVHLATSIKPFSLTAGKVTTADGKTYDMADAGQRQQCMDNNVTNWANQMVAAVKAVDPDAMISASVFTYQIVRKKGPNGLFPIDAEDPRFPARPLMLFNSDLSYIDVHTYPTTFVDNYSLREALESSEYSKWDKTLKPLLMGEFGTFKDKYETIEQACEVMTAHRKEAFDLGFSGALYWTWDTFSQKRIWHLLEQDGFINNALKPCN